MFTYDRYAKLYGWPPSVVRSLTLDEMFWLPVISEAEAEAAETLRPKD
jgi:hypothetical protein